MIVIFEHQGMVKLKKVPSTLTGILERMRASETAAVERKLSGGLIIRYFPAGFLTINAPEKFMIGRVDKWPSMIEFGQIAARIETLTGKEIDYENAFPVKIGSIYFVEIQI